MHIALADGTPLRGDFVLRAEQRFDLTAIPTTLQLTVRADASMGGRIGPDTVLQAGSGADRYRVVKMRRTVTNMADGASALPTEARELTAFPEALMGVARPQPRAVVKERKSLGEIYRACGATCRIAEDIETSRFTCLVGHLATPLIAVLLQEEAAAPVWGRNGTLSFIRLSDLFTRDPVLRMAEDSTQVVQSPFLEGHEIPWAWSTADDGSIIVGRRDPSRPSVYIPRTSERVLNNLTKCLVTRRKVDRGQFAGNLRAGDRIDIGGERHVVVTAAHVWENGGGGSANQTTSLWLGQLYVR